MAGLVAVVANDSVAGIREMSSLMTMAASAWLSFVPEMNQNFSKADEVGYGALNSDLVVADTILNIFPSRFFKITTADVKNITIFGQTVDDVRVGHFVRRVKNLKVCERAVNICSGNSPNAGSQSVDCIFPMVVFYSLIISFTMLYYQSPLRCKLKLYINSLYI